MSTSTSTLPPEINPVWIGNKLIKPKYSSRSPGEILDHSTKKQLLETIPDPRYKINCTSYELAQKLDWGWYLTLIGLNENVSNSRKRADKMNFDFDLTLKNLVDIWLEQKGHCALTGVELSNESGSLEQKNPYRASVDRIDSSKGYTKDNVRLLCHWANNAKSTYNDDLFRSMCKMASLQTVANTPL
jgi:hypothetical protein